MDYENEYRLMFYCEIRHTGLQGPPCGFNTMQHLNMHVCVMVNYANILTNYVLAILTLSDPGYFRQLTMGGGALKAPPPPLRSQKLLCQSSPYHTCEFYQVFLA